MFPGLVAGHYTPRDTHIELSPLAASAGARFVVDRVVALDLYTRTAELASGQREAFDLLSLDIGSTPDVGVPGAAALALAVKPIEAFLTAWDRLQAEALTGGVRTIAVVGGGAGGVEMLLAMQHRLASIMGADVPRFALVTDTAAILAQHGPIVRARFGRILVERGVVLHLASPATAVEPGTIIVSQGRRIAVDRIVWATSAAAAPWLAESGLACDDTGFVRVDDHLRSTSHQTVFAAGDCAAQLDRPRPKSGVFAVRQGPPLAANLRRAAREAALARYVPQRHALALISTGGKHAIASRGPFVAEGDWVWRWKDRIDRAFMAKYRLRVAAAVPS
jgi:selenide,water dikinase